VFHRQPEAPGVSIVHGSWSPYDSQMIEYVWRGAFDSAEVESLHAECFEREPSGWDWVGQVDGHSLGWVCARHDGALVGWVNVAWDGAGHAFILDTIVTGTHRRRGIATQLVVAATAGARAADCEWLHVDFEDHLTAFYFEACGFTETNAGLIRL
jgi:ribosomal protein S18 acetylase RimI-like enzyme